MGKTRLLSGDCLSHGQESHRSSATFYARPSPRHGATPETIPAVVQWWPSGHEGYPLCPCSRGATQALIRLCAHSLSMRRWLTLVSLRTWRSRWRGVYVHEIGATTVGLIQGGCIVEGGDPQADVQAASRAECPSSARAQVVSEGHERSHVRIAPSPGSQAQAWTGPATAGSAPDGRLRGLPPPVPHDRRTRGAR